MDGMFYYRESDNQSDNAESVHNVAKLLLITVVVACAIVGVMLVLSWAGIDVTTPPEFPSIAPEVG